MERILSAAQIEEIEQVIRNFDAAVNGFLDEIKEALNLFATSPIAQSLFESGVFGASRQEFIKNIIDGVTQYIEGISVGPESLVTTTLQFVANQRELLVSGATAAGSAYGAAVGAAFGSPTGVVKGSVIGAAAGRNRMSALLDRVDNAVETMK